MTVISAFWEDKAERSQNWNTALKIYQFKETLNKVPGSISSTVGGIGSGCKFLGSALDSSNQKYWVKNLAICFTL